MDWNQNESDGFVTVKAGQGHSKENFGPELGFAETMSKTRSEETTYIIKSSYGATLLLNQWLDGTYGRGTYYGWFMDYVKESMSSLLQKTDAEIAGMMWMQGESDADSGAGEVYYNNTSYFYSYIKQDLASYLSKDFTFVDACIDAHWNNAAVVNAAKIKFAEDADGCYCLDTSSFHTNLEPTDSPDISHYDCDCEIQLGNMFAQKFIDIDD